MVSFEPLAYLWLIYLVYLKLKAIWNCKTNMPFFLEKLKPKSPNLGFLAKIFSHSTNKQTDWLNLVTVCDTWDGSWEGQRLNCRKIRWAKVFPNFIVSNQNLGVSGVPSWEPTPCQAACHTWGNTYYKQNRYGPYPCRTFRVAKKTLISQVTKPTNVETAGKEGLWCLGSLEWQMGLLRGQEVALNNAMRGGKSPVLSQGKEGRKQSYAESFLIWGVPLKRLRSSNPK